MTKQIAEGFDKGNDDINIKEPHLSWLIGFLFVVSFIGLFSVVPLRKIMILGYKLPYPSGTAAAHLINNFHTPQGLKLASEQVLALFKFFGASFLWSFFQWFYGAGNDCGFSAFATFGLKAYKQKFYFDFSATYIGVGMICPHIINISMFIGSVISWGLLWPYIASKSGEWYNASLPQNSLQGLDGYKVFISIAMILGDGLFHFMAVLFQTYSDLHNKSSVTPINDDRSEPLGQSLSFDDRRRTKVFLKDEIPTFGAVIGYVILALISICAVPSIFPHFKPYFILAAYLIAPFLAFCNSYGCGLTDWSLASSYGKLAIFIFGAWAGDGHGGVLAGLTACGVMMSIVSSASDLIQDFRTGYMTLASPRAMFVSQVIGTAMGCVIAPSVFWVFYKAFPLGSDNSQFPAPYAKVYRGIAIIGADGFSALPKNCISFCILFFLLAFAINVLREVAKLKNWSMHGYIPSAMGLAIPFYLGSYFTIDMCVGSFIVFVWQMADSKKADMFAPAIASGMICGAGIWSLPSSLLAIVQIHPPMCMRFLSSAESAALDALLNAKSGNG